MIRPIPEVSIDLRFEAPAGRYYFWIRGKCEVEGEYSDSIWIQVDEEIGTDTGSPHLGNWNSFQPAGECTWAGNVFLRHPIVLRYSGGHRIRIQPRQIPHRIDQIWISKWQDRIPLSRST